MSDVPLEARLAIMHACISRLSDASVQLFTALAEELLRDFGSTVDGTLKERLLIVYREHAEELARRGLPEVKELPNDPLVNEVRGMLRKSMLESIEDAHHV